MSLQSVLIIGQDPERLSNVLDILAEESIIDCEALDTLVSAPELIEINLPDLVLVLADELETNGEDVNGFCALLRERTSEHRPVLVVQTATQDEEKRIEYLINGADDTLSVQLSLEELRIRLLVHLRRNLDILSNRVTRLPGLNLSAKNLQRRINRGLPWALMVMELDHFDVYCEVYGQIPGDQVLRTFAAMLGNMILPPDLVGHTESASFVVITHPDNAEKIAVLLCRQFDTVSPNFYSEDDKARGYIVSVVDEKVSRRVRLLSLSIGVVTSQTQALESYKAAFNAASEMRVLARRHPGSNWVSERLKLTSAQSAVAPEKQTVLVVESDAAFAFLLQTTLEMQGYEVDTVSNTVDALEILQNRPIKLVLMDSLLNSEPVGWDLCREIKTKLPGTSVIFISTLHDREKALGAGADLYLPKPFELISLFTWIDRLFKGH